VEPASVRARRALALIGLAAVAVAAAAAVYLGPGLVRAAWPRPQERAAATPPVWMLVYASFGDAEHGAIFETEPNRNPVTYLTSNGGRSWAQPLAAASLVTFLDRDHAVAFGFAGLITVDGGRTWTSVAAPPIAHRFIAVPGLGVIGGPAFLDPAHGWWLDDGTVSGSQPALWRSGDGGRTWTQLPATGLPAGRSIPEPTFVDPLRGVIPTSPPAALWPSLLVTRDGGESWRDVDLPPPPLPGTHLVSSPATRAVALAHGDHLLLAVDTLPAEAALTPGRLTHWSSASRDGGLTWTPWSIVPATRSLAQSPPVFDDAGHLLLLDDQGLLASGDDGRTWRTRPVRMPGGARGAALLRTAHGALFASAWRTGPGGNPAAGAPLTVGADLLLRSRDGGTHWSDVPLPVA